MHRTDLLLLPLTVTKLSGAFKAKSPGKDSPDAHVLLTCKSGSSGKLTLPKPDK